MSATTRRDFLQTATGLAAGVAALSSAGAADKTAATPLPTVKLGSHTVTRLIIGGNPIYGYSHFNKLFSQHMTDWHTPERVQQLLKRAKRPASTPGRTATPSGRCKTSTAIARPAAR